MLPLYGAFIGGMRRQQGFFVRRARRGILNGLFTLVLVTLFCLNGYIPKNAASDSKTPNLIARRGFPWIRRNLVEVSSRFNASESDVYNVDKGSDFCQGLFDHLGYNTSCEFVKAHPQCRLGGFFDYLKFYYCDCNGSAWTFLLLAIWLAALFYVLGNTAADYFCPSLEKLSNLLKLSPRVAGVALLPLGNGAPDVFASIAAFVGAGAGDVGLNSVLGGAVFVTCIVVGAVSLCVDNQLVQIDKKCFVRDIAFFMIAILALFVILLIRRVDIWCGIALLSIYVLYAIAVAANELLGKQVQRLKLDAFTPLLPVRGQEEENSMLASLLEIEPENDESHSNSSLPQWMWATNVAIYSNQFTKFDGDKHLWGWNDEDVFPERRSLSCASLCTFLELPLTVPRRLTIPLIDESNWSKTYATASALLSPILLAYLWSSQDNIVTRSRILAYSLGASLGCILGLLAYHNTRQEHPPPQTQLLPWVLSGFVMSIAWFYIIANELVGLLVALGVIAGVSPSILGLTVLAWGNSIGDLVSNVALAMSGGESVQIAMSGCYAGPVFNTLVGLGVSMVVGAWSSEAGWFAIPRDDSLYLTLGFLVVGLVWALVVLPTSDMRPNKVLGMGLIALYLLFLFLRMGSALGIV